MCQNCWIWRPEQDVSCQSSVDIWTNRDERRQGTGVLHLVVFENVNLYCLNVLKQLLSSYYGGSVFLPEKKTVVETELVEIHHLFSLL